MENTNGRNQNPASRESIRRKDEGRRAMRVVCANGLIQVAKSLQYAVKHHYSSVEIRQIIETLQGQVALLEAQYRRAPVDNISYYIPAGEKEDE